MDNHRTQGARRPVVGITHGDWNGIGYEVIIKALSDERILEGFTPVIYGSSKLFGFYKKTLSDIGPAEAFVINGPRQARPRKINIINCLPDGIVPEPGQATVEAAKGAMTSLQAAVDDLKSGDIDILVTAPVNKRSMDKAGFGSTGHTEYLQKQFGVEDVLMFMVSDSLRVGVATAHIPLRDVPGALNTQMLVDKLRIMKDSLTRDFRIDSPKIAVLGLNPHCGDGGLIGSEESEIIAPAVKQASAEGINAFGPYSADGFFSLGNYTRFDAVLAMYHDQGLAPFKAISFEDGVNFTAGLPIVRTSPDHGTAFEKAGTGTSDPDSMRNAIYKAVDIWRNRLEYDELVSDKMPERRLDNGRGHDGGRNGRPQVA